MKWICVLAITAIAGWAMVEEPAKAKTPAAKAKKAPAKAPAKSSTKASAKAAEPKKVSTPAAHSIVEMPKDAKEIYPGTYRWVDPKGKAWIYTKTPFGLMSGEEPPKEPEYVPSDWKVFEDGDSVTFERPWPFSDTRTMRWTVKKAEMSETEEAVYKQSKAPTATAKQQ